MKQSHIKTRYIIFLVFIFMLLSIYISHDKIIQTNTTPTDIITTTAKIFATAITATNDDVDDPPLDSDKDIKIRRGYPTYESYIQHQLNKTLNPKLRQLWKTRDWTRKIRVFIEFFNDLKDRGLLSNSSKALSVGARMGQEVEALKRVGVSDSIGMDLVPHPPLVVHGDFHQQPFDDETFDFEFSNVFDHALYPSKFVGEIERTLKGGGVCVLHVDLGIKTDKYSANHLLSIEPLKKMFKRSDLVSVRKVDGFGMDTEVVFKKRG